MIVPTPLARWDTMRTIGAITNVETVISAIFNIENRSDVPRPTVFGTLALFRRYLRTKRSVT